MRVRRRRDESRGARRFFAGTTEVTLGPAASLRIAGLQELPANRSSRSSTAPRAIGEDASLQWALAQLGGRLVRSRIDNRLVGDRSSVEQVEIVFGERRAAVRPDLVHDATSARDTTGDLLSKGVAPRPRPDATSRA